MTWIDDNRGQEPWSLDQDEAWDDDQDSGAWAFTEQADKWGYLNNPRWSNHPKGAADPISATEFCEGKGIPVNTEETHKPCGHWHKREKIITTTYPGNLYGVGENKHGQLGLETGMAGFATYEPLMLDATFTQVACGYYHSIALKSDGTLWVTGRNTEGQLGLGDNDRRYSWTRVGSDSDWTYISCGGYNSFAIKSDGTLYACGHNNIGQLGLGDEVNKDEFTKVGTDTDWVEVHAGFWHMVALKNTGILWGSGYNDTEGALGLGAGVQYVTSMTVLPGTDWATFDCGEYETIGIKTDGALWGTGYNWQGMLGLGHDNEVTVFTQVSITNCSKIACGPSHTVIIKTDGTLWGCGFNSLGELGPDHASYTSTFAQIESASNWSAVYAGVYQTGVVNTDDELWVCGGCGHGDFGIGEYYYHVNDLTQVPGEWTMIGLGGWYGTIALKSDGTLWVSGSNYYGMLGSGYGTEVYTLTLANDYTWTAVDSWGLHTLAIKDDGTVWGAGYEAYGQLGFGTNGGYVRWQFTQIPVSGIFTQVACGSYHSLLLRDGQIWSAGWSASGQLGRAAGAGTKLFGLITDTDWAFIAAGSAVSMAIKDNGLLYSWGDNNGGNAGQLGLGDSINRTVPTQCIGTGWKQVSIGG